MQPEPHNLSPLAVVKKALQHFKDKDLEVRTAIDVGTYYGGWSEYLADVLKDAQIFAIQTPTDNLLNHIPNDRGEYHDSGTWKKLVLRKFPEEYHSYYNFDLLIKNIQEANKNPCGNNVSLIVDTSPFKYQWKYNFDLCLVDVAPTFEKNVEQLEYWKTFCNPQGMIVMTCFDCGDQMFEHIKMKLSDMWSARKFTIEGIDYVCAVRKGRRYN